MTKYICDYQSKMVKEVSSMEEPMPYSERELNHQDAFDDATRQKDIYNTHLANLKSYSMPSMPESWDGKEIGEEEFEVVRKKREYYHGFCKVAIPITSERKEETDWVKQYELLRQSNNMTDSINMLVKAVTQSLTNKEETVRISKKNYDRFQVQSLRLGLLMDDTRHYLMGVDSGTPVTEIVETSLDKLGFGKNGLQSNFMTE